jgi:hypothetical protein
MTVSHLLPVDAPYHVDIRAATVAITIRTQERSSHYISLTDQIAQLVLEM